MFKARFGNKFIVNWHHKLLCNEIEDLVWGRSVANVGAAGPTELLVINMPPRYTKTEICVVNFVPWVLTFNPAAKFIHSSFSDDLVNHNSSQAREMLDNEAYAGLWNVNISPETDSKSFWLTEQAGGLYAAPAKGTITGFGAGTNSHGAYGRNFAGAIIIDDPLKPDDARSDVIRGAVNERLLTTFVSRRNSRETPIVLIMQRLHEDDMTGFILNGHTGLRVRHVKLPALQPDGTALWPYKHTADELINMQNAEPYVFSGQMQQDPSPPQGRFFKNEWVQYYE